MPRLRRYATTRRSTTQVGADMIDPGRLHALRRVRGAGRVGQWASGIPPGLRADPAWPCAPCPDRWTPPLSAKEPVAGPAAAERDCGTDRRLGYPISRAKSMWNTGPGAERRMVTWDGRRSPAGGRTGPGEYGRAAGRGGATAGRCAGEEPGGSHPARSPTSGPGRRVLLQPAGTAAGARAHAAEPGATTAVFGLPFLRNARPRMAAPVRSTRIAAGGAGERRPVPGAAETSRSASS